MPLNDQQLDHLANLAKLHLDEQERPAMLSQLSDLLGYFEQLAAVDTHELEPLQRPLELLNVWRFDEAGAVFEHEVIQQLAPEMVDDLIKIPRTLY